ncbi:hypothetical protein Dsin_015889 [Dipteronia sinensis]|uniref:Uncharacterized protein n=1 Tax=Dipteronia sinensis TaxID=43782 RepID=A0AAE0AD03_9ROSI|nr:hypothetical protein Dsin_015889 [Dipteronia sinensis]
MEMEQETFSKTKPDGHFSLPVLVNPNQSDTNQILSVASAVNNLDRYSILRTRPGPEFMGRLKTLMLILDPDRNKLVFTEEAFKVVCDAWSVLSNIEKKTQDGKDISFFEIEQNNKEEEEQLDVFTENEQKKKTHFDEKDSVLKNNEKERQEESGENTNKDKKKTFWTVCPFCYYMYEYEKWYEECCLRCQNHNCRRAFHGVAVPEPKNDILVEGGDHYYCGLGLFPLKYSWDGSNARVYNTNDVVVISDSDDDNGDGEAISVNNVGRKVDVRVTKAKEEENLKCGEKGCLGVMQGSGKTEEINGGKRRMHVKSVGRKSKVIRRRDVKSKRMESMNEPEVKGLDLNMKFGQESNGDAHEMEIGSGTGDGCFDNADLEFFKKDGDVFVGLKFDE